jgi:hypothetical protein
MERMCLTWLLSRQKKGIAENKNHHGIAARCRSHMYFIGLDLRTVIKEKVGVASSHDLYQ